jgi:hypothetical protein
MEFWVLSIRGHPDISPLGKLPGHQTTGSIHQYQHLETLYSKKHWPALCAQNENSDTEQMWPWPVRPTSVATSTRAPDRNTDSKAIAFGILLRSVTYCWGCKGPPVGREAVSPAATCVGRWGSCPDLPPLPSQGSGPRPKPDHPTQRQSPATIKSRFAAPAVSDRNAHQPPGASQQRPSSRPQVPIG